jgi:N-glycosylase/DNA lyase
MPTTEIILPASDYDLAATLDSGQVFRWQRIALEREQPALQTAWVGVLGKHVLQLTQTPAGIRAAAAQPVDDWNFLREFLQSDVNLPTILKTFPDDAPMRAAVAQCHGLRLLRQDPWECLASFILSSTKQIVQIRQIVGLLCERFGEPLNRQENIQHSTSDFEHPMGAGLKPLGVGCSRLNVECFPEPTGRGISFAFPTPQRLAACAEAELRGCKMGFRAAGLLDAARQIADGRMDLEKIRSLDYAAARAGLMSLRGVGPKIADCVLLFAYGFDAAFPVDVWVERALQELYFPRRRASRKRLLKFAATHFGPHAGYAQQYLFHYMRTGRAS